MDDVRRGVRWRAPPAARALLVAEADGPAWARPADALDVWLTEATSCAAPGLEGEAAPWVNQAHEEAGLAWRALALFRRTRPRFERISDSEWRVFVPDPDDVLALSVRRRVSVARGPQSGAVRVRRAARRATRARQQTATGAWTWRRDAIEEDSNATDVLIRLALGAAASLDPAAELTVSVDGQEMGRGEVMPFAVRPGTVVIARHGTAVNRVRV